MTRVRIGVGLALVLVLAAPASAGPAQERQARELYDQGAKAFETGDYQTAYDRFRESFQLSHQPALLYDISSALQSLKRPHDAAEALRAYLRVAPNDAERPQIEERVRVLEEEQRLADQERRALEPPPPPVAATPPPALVAPRIVYVPDPGERRRRNRGIAIGVTVGAVVIAAVTIGLVFGLQKDAPPLTRGDLGPYMSTR